MPTVIGVGISSLKNPYEATCAALGDAIKKTALVFEEKANELFIVFLTEDYDPKIVLKAINEKSKTQNIIGFTVAGIFTEEIITTTGILISRIKSDEMNFSLDIERGLSKDQRSAGISLGHRINNKLTQKEQNDLLLLMPDGITNTVSGLVESIFYNLGSGILYAGGGSGDNLRFLKTYQFVRDKVETDSVVCTLIKSKKPIGVSLSHGWMPISPPLIVTKSEGPVIMELDWENASDVYFDFLKKFVNKNVNLEEFAKVAMSYPFGIPQTSEGINYIIRDPIKKEADGSIICVGDVPENAVVRIMHADKLSLQRAARQAANSAVNQTSNLSGLLVFSCVSRYIFYEDNFMDEINVIRETANNICPVFGCMTFGEIGSLGGGPPEFHNKSIVVCAFPK